MSDHLMNTCARLPVAFERGGGVWLWDTQGRRYLDALCGIGVTGVGHAHPRLAQAIAEQAARLVHVSNRYRIPEQERLAQRLCALAGMDRVFFCNSGSEACTAAHTTLEIIAEEGLLDNAQRMGERILGELRQALGALPGVRDIRGKGLMIGVELDRPCGEPTAMALERGLLIDVTADTVVRVEPALSLQAEEARTLVERLGGIVREFLAEPVGAAG
jgi:acetylornithine/succinyldiaminopimelate/putrescine aminotransferase